MDQKKLYGQQDRKSCCFVFIRGFVIINRIDTVSSTWLDYSLSLMEFICLMNEFQPLERFNVGQFPRFMVFSMWLDCKLFMMGSIRLMNEFQPLEGFDIGQFPLLESKKQRNKAQTNLKKSFVPKFCGQS